MLTPRHVFRTVRLGIKNLLLHKARSALTMLGIIFGVCSVIAMLAIGEGASAEAQDAIRRLGSTNIIARSIKPPDDREQDGASQSFVLDYGLTYRDAYRFLATVPGVAHVAPSRRMQAELRFLTAKEQTQVMGTLPLYATVMNLPVRRGRFLTDLDEANQANVCVLGADLAKRLFLYQDPLSEEVWIGANAYRVVGILGEAERTGADPRAGSGQDWQQRVYIPLSTARSLFGEVIANRSSGSMTAERVELHEVVVQLAGPEVVESAASAMQALLTRFHKQTDYEMVVPLRLLRQAEETKRIFNVVLGSIAGISLLVGGIGIMNIMMATVTERTREIGVRRALGARKRDIVMQFLVETVVLSVGGGIVGVGLGVLIPSIVTRLSAMQTIVTWWSLIVAFGISAFVGLVFGIYPASRAANLDPIEALRHE